MLGVSGYLGLNEDFDDHDYLAAEQQAARLVCAGGAGTVSYRRGGGVSGSVRLSAIASDWVCFCSFAAWG